MTIYVAAFSAKELSYDDFFLVMSHYVDSGVQDFKGSIDMIRIKSHEAAYAYIFRATDSRYDLKNMPIVLMLNHDLHGTSSSADVDMLDMFELHIASFVSMLVVLAEPADLETYTTRNGNAVSLLKDINVKNISDLFTNSARSLMHVV